MYLEVVLTQLLVCAWAVHALSPTKLLIVSFDGFRHDYVNKTSTPNIFSLRQKSAYAEHMRNVFPTKTFPNHVSLATGVYVEHHGVLETIVQDHGDNVSYSQRMFDYDPNLAPIWIRNQKNGGVSGTMMWVAGELTFQNAKAKYHQKFSIDITWEQKIDMVIAWFKDAKTPANLAMIYFNQPDESSHFNPSHSPQVRAQIDAVDVTVKLLDRKLHDSKLDVNVFLVSDHGMVDVPYANIIDLSVAGNKPLQQVSNLYTTIGSSPILQVIPAIGKATAVHEAFRKVAKTKGHFSVYTKSKLPQSWHIRNNDRTPEILIVADLGYAFHDRLQWTPTPRPGSIFGMHGYDNSNAEMHPFFMAWGPGIKKNFKLQPFDSVDLYSLWCKLLDITPGKNDGVLGNVKDMLTR